MSDDSDPPPPYQAQDPGPTTTPLANTGQSTFYHVYRSRTGNYKVLLDDKTHFFYINSRTLRTPDLIVHRGNGDQDLAVADCMFPDTGSAGSHYIINRFRKPNNKSSLVQTKMGLDGRFTTTVPVPSTTGPAINAQRPFIWKYTPNLTLIDEETSQTAAALHGMTFGLTKCFVLETQTPYGYGFELLVVTSAVTIYEKQRRGDSKGPTILYGPTSRVRGVSETQIGFAGSIGGSTGGAVGPS